MTATRYKLLFYVPSLGDGGGQRLWAAMATACHQAGHTVEFAVDFEADESAHLLDPDIPCTVLGRGHVRSVMSLTKLLRRTRPDVALSAIAGSNLKLVAACQLSGSQTKVIQTFHGHTEWQTGWLSYITARALPITSRLSARTIAVSEPLQNELITRWKSAPHRTVHLPNPVLLPPSVAAPSKADIQARPPVILAVGRLAKVKDYPTLIKAFAKLNVPDARLIIVGKGPEEANLKALIARLGIADTVTLAGFCSEPWPYYQRAKCLALTSRTESFGNVIVEALAHGLPVVATETDGATHIISSPDLGRHVAIGDIDGVAVALSKILNEPGDPAPRSARAQDFSIGARLPSYEQVISDIVTGERHQPLSQLHDQKLENH